MSPWRAGQTSPHQLSTVSPPKSVFRGRSAYTALFGTVPRPSSQPPPRKVVRSPHPLVDCRPGQPSIQAPRCAPRKPGNRVPAIHQGPAPHRPRSKSPGQGSSASRHRFKLAPRSTSYSSGTSSPRHRARSSHQVSGAPRKATRPSVPGALATRSTQGEGRLVAQAAQRPHPNCQAALHTSCGSGASRLRPAPPRPGHQKGVARYGGSLQASPRLAASQFFGRGSGALKRTSKRFAILTMPPRGCFLNELRTPLVMSSVFLLTSLFIVLRST
ncbi:hypothetical protein NDU88_002729 [Pleurodeles waltl]|uniref:Uncharacterized protein n=1 Tax=Pleurodeles waltl TaxID=8319 RepID=A0AAV7KWX9_PLEWA|nr:hypothetical protein NDU88_002729 [Pleurodeles waltl]